MTTLAARGYSQALVAKIHLLFSLQPLVLLSLKMKEKTLFNTFPDVTSTFQLKMSVYLAGNCLAEIQRAMHD